MTRASLGHGGQPLRAGVGTTSVYVLVTLAAVSRLVAGLAPDRASDLLLFSGTCWIAGYALFAVLYLPLYLRPAEGG